MTPGFLRGRHRCGNCVRRDRSSVERRRAIEAHADEPADRT